MNNEAQVKNKNLPQLRFTYGYPLDAGRRSLYEKKDLGEYPSIERVKEEVAAWRDMWSEFNEDQRAMRAIAEVAGIVYPWNIRAFVIGGGLPPTSTPLILPVQRFKADKEGDRKQLLVHELLHLFVGDQEVVPETKPYWDMIADKYEEESPKTQHHIIIYALMIKILGELSPELDVEDFVNEDWDNYLRAYEIVQERGAEEVIGEFYEHT